MNNFNLISAYIATIIILVITIGIGAVLYFYFSGYISQLTSETEETTIKSIIECSQAKIDGYAYKEFKYRIPITITENSGNTLTDYQVLVTLDTASLISQGKMRTDHGDIRFTDSDGITLLNYWIENFGFRINVSAFYGIGTTCINDMNNFPNTPNSYGNNDWWTYDVWSCDDCDYYVRIYFNFTGGLRRAILEIASDDGHAVWINGHYLGSAPSTNICHASGTAQRSWDITQYIVQGQNEIRIWCSERGGGEVCFFRLFINGLEIRRNGEYSQNARIWVKVPNIPDNSNKTIYLYYGNPEATSLSSVEDVFIREIDGLVLHLTFDEGSGTIAYDSSGNNNHGTLINDPTWVDGIFGKALSFDGVDDYVRISDSPSLRLTTLSVIAWMYPLSYKWNIIISKSTATANAPNYEFGVSMVSYRPFAWSGNSGAESTSIIPLNSWVHLAYVVDAEKVKFYVNGTFTNEVSWSVNTNWDNYPAFIGVDYPVPRSGDYDFSNMIVDEVLIYNRSLTQEEISDLYNNYGYSTPNYPGKTLVRKYAFPEPTISLGNEETSPIIKLTMINLGIELGKRYLIKLIYEDGKIAVRNITLDKNLSSGESKEIYLTDLPKGIIRKIEIYSIDVCPNMLVGIRSVNIEV